ncbi:MAG TPA: helix-turn-helix transcriptional regulator [Paracoccaceae bacterium]|nr:helix-turn-helix transcriptional regulator [Paracoccaceae bacterium]
MRSADEVDAHVGRRLRRRRMALGISQEHLGQALGLTFQQIQKYEKGQNRIGAGRLYRIAIILSVPVQYFFDGLGADAPIPNGGAVPDSEIQAFVTSPEGRALSSGFVRIDDPVVRRRIIELIATLARDRP